jgi:hypothetical protein
MKAEFISHEDFYSLSPINVYHRENDENGEPLSKKLNIAESHPEDLRNKHIIYRKKFTLGAYKTAIARISADDYYKLYINGRFVAEGPTPSYPRSYFYNEIDITPFLSEGENTIAVHTYYQGLINRVWVSGDLLQMLWFELLADGNTVLVSDGSWRCKYHTGYTQCGKFGYDTAYAECYDARSADADFYKADFDDSAFGYAKVNQGKHWVLRKQATPTVEVYEVEPEKIEKTDFGMRIYMATEAVGRLCFDAKGQAGDEIILHYGEELNEDGSVRFDMRCYCRYEEKMLLSGGNDRLMQFDYKGFRYAEIICPAGVDVENIKMQVRHFPYTERHTYTTDNEKLRQVLSLCKNTIKYSTQEQFLDCPTREKGAYLGDLMVSGRAHAVLTGNTELLKQTIENFTKTSFISEGLMACAGGSLMQEIGDYSLEFPAILNWIYSIDGDIEFLRRNEPYATGIYNHYKQYENSEGLLDRVIEWNLVDWPANLRDGYDYPLTRPVGYGVHNVINALWYGLKIALDELYGILGIKLDTESKKTKDSFIKAFYSKEAGLFVDSPKTLHASVHSNIFPLLFGIGCEDGEIKERVISHIEKKGLTSMGVYMAYFALAALKRAGRYDLCEKLACDEGAWLNMIREGATLTYEAWGKDQKFNTSLCHPWATAPLIIFADGVREY